MDEQVKSLHHRLHQAIDEEHTDESLNIINLLYEKSSSGNEESFINFYRHTPCKFTPLVHAIIKENAVVVLSLLKNGCDPNICVNRNSFQNEIPPWFEFLFKVIGNPAFEPVLVRILEAINKPVLDENSNTVLHIICKKKLTSWLQMILNAPSQQYLLFHANNQGYLPMHIAANMNFLDFFNLVLCGLSSHSNCSTETKQIPVVERHFPQKIGKSNDSDTNTMFPLVNEEMCIKEKMLSKQQNKAGLKSKGKIPSKEPMGWRFRNKMFHPSTKSFSLKNVDINTPILGKGTTVLHIAAQYKFKELVKVLLEMGANVNGSTNGNSHSPLFTCLNSYKVEKDKHDTAVVDVCKHLIEAGADVNEYSSFQCIRSIENDMITPLHLAAKSGAKDVIELLLNNGADPKACDTNSGRLPLQIALEESQTESALTLLNQRLYPDRFLAQFTDKYSNTLLHAAGNCSEEIIVKLMNVGCSLDQPNEHNVIPLHKAIFYGNISYIHAILSARPEIVNLRKNVKACPPLHLAASSLLDSLPLSQILLSYGADIYAKAYGKNMAYRRALKNDCYKNTLYLCEQMSHPFTLTERKELLDYAESRKDMEMALRLTLRLENIPSLVLHCLDAVRQLLISNSGSLKDTDQLPIPVKMKRALKYQDAHQC